MVRRIAASCPQVRWDVVVVSVVAVNIFMIQGLSGCVAPWISTLISCDSSCNPVTLVVIPAAASLSCRLYCLHGFRVFCLDLDSCFCLSVESRLLLPSLLESGLTAAFRGLSIDGSWNRTHFMTKTSLCLVLLFSHLYLRAILCL